MYTVTLFNHYISHHNQDLNQKALTSPIFPLKRFDNFDSIVCNYSSQELTDLVEQKITELYTLYV